MDDHLKSAYLSSLGRSVAVGHGHRKHLLRGVSWSATKGSCESQSSDCYNCAESGVVLGCSRVDASPKDQTKKLYSNPYYQACSGGPWTIQDANSETEVAREMEPESSLA